MMSEIIEKENVVNLLWTGGWDSTFRLLQIVLEERKAVQPYYIIFKDRWSSDKEIDTMNDIKITLQQSYPFSKQLIRDTIHINEEDIIVDDKIADLYSSLKNKHDIGSQYKTIVGFAKQYKLIKVDLGLTKGRYGKFKKYMKKSDAISINELDDSLCEGDTYEFYKYFNFPLIDYYKSDMAAIAEDKGWISILNNIWICHKPLFGKIPCGGCEPCIHAANDQFASNSIPAISKFIGPKLKKIYNSKLFHKLKRRNLKS